MIHCIGDSHSAVFSGEEKMQPEWPNRSNDTTEFFKSYRIGPATAYMLANKKPIIDNILNNIVINKGDKIMFCFGEVDIRAHVIKQAELQNRLREDIVKEIIDAYSKVILDYKNKGYDMIVWGPIASWHPYKPYTGGPSFGSCIERNLVTKYFNELLENFCVNNNIEFVTIFPDMIDQFNITKPEYLDNWEGSHMHLSQSAMPLILKTFRAKKLI